MAAKKTNGHDAGTERMVEVLERIERGLTGLHQEVRATNGRLDALSAEVRATNSRLDATNSRLDATNSRLEALREELHEFRVETHDELLDLHAEQHAQRMEIKTSIELRLAKLEAAVFRPTGT